MKRQSGFTLIEALLILIIAGIIGGTGWYVYSAHNKANKTLDQANQVASSSAGTSKKAAPKLTDPTASWYLYESPGGIYKIKLADGWKLIRPAADSVSLLGWQTSDITYKGGVKATVTVQEGGRDGPVPFTLYVVGHDGFEGNTSNGQKQDGFKTAQGVEVSKYLYTQATEQEGPGLPKGGKSYTYVISKGSTTIQISHDEVPGDPDNVATVEQVVKTIEI